MPSPEGTLFVRDSRTSKEYKIPIFDNVISATEFKKIKGGSKGSAHSKDNEGLLIYDPGLLNTAIKKSQISSRDEASGLPAYRGYTTKQLEQMGSEFEDVFHLMVFGTYPSEVEKESLRRKFAQEMMNVPDTVSKVVRSFTPTSPAISMILAGLSAYIASYPHAIPAMKGKLLYQGNSKLADKAVIKTTAAYAVVLGITASHRKGISFTSAHADKGFVENLFIMMGLVDPTTKLPNPLVLSIFQRAAIYNADNGMTNSTFVLLVAASSLPDPMSCLISAVSAAYGPLHYGAQEATWNNLREIGKPENVPAFLEQVKRRERRLFGYGHRSYTVEDPRLAPVKGWLKELNVSAASNPLFEIAHEINRDASNYMYFKDRGLSANADFYTVFLFNALGFESDMIAAANLMQRMLGFMAHWRESIDQEIKLFRPLHIYNGPKNSGDSLSKL